MSSPKSTLPTVACFGEVLWDILPRGIFLGGAPLNVAYHASRLGLHAFPISAVGRDFLGNEALRRIQGWGLDSKFIARPRFRPTGTVRGTLDRAGNANYAIAEKVAWDKIRLPKELRRLPHPSAVVYGTLALRGEANRFVFMDLMGTWTRALRVLDLNLRSPHDSGTGVKLALSHAQIVKLNDEELARTTQLPARTATHLERAARFFSREHHSVQLCVTAGANGAGLLWDDEWYWQPGLSISVRDTIGAGDAFLAGFLAAYLLRNERPGDALVRACRMGEFVAARDGATPPYDVDARGQPEDLSPEVATPPIFPSLSK